MPAPRYAWDAALGRFRYAESGRLVPVTLIRDAIDTALRNQRGHVAALRERLVAGRIDAAEWELAMRRMIKDTHLYTTAAAKGGFEQLTQQDFGRVGGHVAREYGFLRRFRDEVESGLPLDGRMRARAESYAEAARRTYHDAEKEVNAEHGKRMVVNILHPADHCAECLALSEAGPMDVDEMPSPGDRECRSNCQCSLEYTEG